MTPRELSEELRNGDNEDLRNRRWIVGLSMIGTAMSVVVSAYQFGLIKKLPDPPISVFDSSKVDASDFAYKRFQTPDGVMMLANYGLTMWTAAAGGANRAQTHPVLPLLMAAKTLSDCATTAKLSSEEWQENKKLCFYCHVATACTVASAVLSMREAAKGWKNLRK